MSRAATHHQRCMPNIVYQCRFMHARPAEAVHVRVQPTAPPLIGLRLPPRPPTLTPLPPLDVTLLQDLEARERRCAGGTLVAYRPRTHRYTNRGHWNTISKVQWRYSDDVLRHHLLFNRGLRACTPILPSLPRDMLLAMIYTRMDASSFQALLNQVRGHDAWRALPTRAQLRGVVPGYVYAFSNRQRSKVKIGITSEPVARKTWHRRCYGDTMNFDVRYGLRFDFAEMSVVQLVPMHVGTYHQPCASQSVMPCPLTTCCCSIGVAADAMRSRYRRPGPSAPGAAAVVQASRADSVPPVQRAAW